MKQERLVGRHKRPCRSRAGTVTTLIRHHFTCLRRVLRARNVFRAFAATRLCPPLDAAGQCVGLVSAIKINKSGENPLVPRIRSATKLPARPLSGSIIYQESPANKLQPLTQSLHFKYEQGVLLVLLAYFPEGITVVSSLESRLFFLQIQF